MGSVQNVSDLLVQLESTWSLAKLRNSVLCHEILDQVRRMGDDDAASSCLTPTGLVS